MKTDFRLQILDFRWTARALIAVALLMLIGGRALGQQQTFLGADTLPQVRVKLNANFTEVYTAIDGLTIGADVQAYDPDLTTWAGISPTANAVSLVSAADYAAMKALLTLGNVENTALSTWAGSTNVTTLGTISTGSWNATAIPVSKGGTGQTSLAANVQSILAAADYAAIKGLLTLGNVENTALSTWAGSTNVTTVGTISTGSWNATAIPISKGGTGQTSLAANVQSILAAADYAAIKGLLTLGNVENTALSTWAGSSNITTVGTISTGTWNGTAIGIAKGGTGQTSLSANVQSFFGAADYAAMRTQLGLAIGTNVQAYDADLTTWAGVTPSANGQSLVSAADYAAMKTLLSLGNVENTALSTWAGSSNLTTFGTVTSGTFSGTLDGSVTLTLGSDATGDIYYRNASGFLTRLAAGTNGHVLTLASGLPSWAAPSGGGGSGAVVAVRSALKTDTQTTTSPPSTAWIDVTGLSITYTPTSASNKIMVIANISLSASNVNAVARLIRDSTPLSIGDASGNMTQASILAANQATYSIQPGIIAVLDSPATTSAVTYKIQIANTQSATTYVNRTSVTDDAAYNVKVASSLTIMEVTP